MPSPQEIKPGARGFGQRRFLIRDRIYAPEPDTAALRLFYNEYPERPAINPDFPQPGRRGPSRAPVTTGQPAATPPGPQTIFPGGRPRESYPLPGGAGGEPLTPPQGQLASLSTEGDTFITSPKVLAGVTTVQSSRKILRPFRIHHVWAKSDQVAGSATFINIKASADNDTSGGHATSGVPVLSPDAQARIGRFAVHNSPWLVYPNFYVWEEGYFLKVVHENTGAVDAEFDIFVSIQYLR